MAQPYLDEHGFELVDVEYVKEGSNWFLRVFVDKDGGIDLDDCSMISEYLGQSWMKMTLFLQRIFWKCLHQAPKDRSKKRRTLLKR